VAVDLVRTSTDNPCVSARRIRRSTVASLLMAGTVWATVLPPAHIHLATDDHDHHHAAIEHAHWAAHHQSRLALDDDDGRVLVIDHPALVRLAHASTAPPQTAVIALLALYSPLGSPVITQRASGNAVRDGPTARSLFLRGPPLVL